MSFLAPPDCSGRLNDGRWLDLMTGTQSRFSGPRPIVAHSAFRGLNPEGSIAGEA